ncbi:Ypt of gyp1p [Coleophoma crateriformis]|uniref:Ypt of gyp1p n=1 Tax=Coleophoma crateriformis TaxID=565419 RepID=A0A3D8R314_9HELO|nr:Ypt of gyp1p [Coleophoma crateriformis]
MAVGPALDEHGIFSIPYEETLPARPPIPVTVALPREPPEEQHPALRRPLTIDEKKDETKRDSGLAPTTSTAALDGSTNTTEEGSSLSINSDSNAKKTQPRPSTSMQSPPQTPKMVKSESWGSGSMSMFKRPMSRRAETPKSPVSSIQDFSPILTPIPTENLMDNEFLSQMSFSKRGSMMLGGKKAVNSQARLNGGRRQPSCSMLASSSLRVLPDELEKESQKVRSMYETSASYDWHAGKFSTSGDQPKDSSETTSLEAPSISTGLLSPPLESHPRAESRMSSRDTLARNEHELAGGIEDWEDVNGGDVDRYGFIDRQRKSTPGEEFQEPRPPQRVSTVLQMASETPRKKRAFGRSPSTATSRTGFRRAPSRKVSARSLNTFVSSSSKRSISRQHLRAAANRLPGNRDRRWMDEAGDMLTLPPGLADIAEENEGGKAVEEMKKKEWERTEKWRRMAKVVKNGKDGEGMEFEFNTRSPKLIARTWKGIPDRWRSAAWHSFLSTSARKRPDSATDEEIIQAFFRLQDQSSADDVQIDIDVPRTINSHIMFRRRYRGGQRLLFRVLHALSLYFPVTGYVQGMASLAATLLCYYDEERCFVMLVRMWQLRGLDKLYESGFAGLMAALDEFQKSWLHGNDVSQKLDELCIEPTAYGTRWYLTLFNYSIPFPAQLRVWDVFMLLGDSDVSVATSPERPFAGGLDILHAVSAALIDGTREILLDSDFENAMKVLTSWIPVKDEELLMKVTKAELKLHRRRKQSAE